MPSRADGRRKAAGPDLSLPGELTRERLDNGLEVVLLSQPEARIVSTAILYRAGARDEPAGREGIAHFLEHMMFKGSERFGPGEVDRVTQRLGGSNNAFTSHDATVYYFDFAAECWEAALEIEADRMRGLALLEAEVDRERQVILEEIAMYRDDPWDALSQAVAAELYGNHPYGRPILGFATSLRAIRREDLAAFHERFYTPAGAVLVVAGALGAGAMSAVASRFSMASRRAADRPARPLRPEGPRRRVVRYRGETARLLYALPVPAGDAAGFPALRLAAALLGEGRTSRLYRELADELKLCSAVWTDLVEGADPALLAIGAELVAGAEPKRVEAVVRREIESLAAAAPSADELERGRQILRADWLFGHLRVHQQALTLASALGVFGEEAPERSWERSLACSAEAVRAAAEGLVGTSAVIGWSHPRSRAARPETGR